MAVCASCGSGVPDDAAFCSACGQPRQSPPPPQAPPRRPVTFEAKILYVTIVAVALAVAASYFYSRSQDAGVANRAATSVAQKRACFSNQRVIEGAVQQYLAGAVGFVADDMDGPVDARHILISGANEYFKDVPTCPTTGEGYTLVDGTVEDCSAHGHY
jgi:hypothetical protein